MKNKVQVVVIGGGVVGAGTLYHLAKKGWTDVALVERKDLTSGSTWHAAGLLPLFNMSYSVGKLHQYSVDFYHELEQETGMNVGFSVVSNIRLANCQDRMDEYKYYSGVGSTVGVNVKFLTPDEVKEVWPLCNTEGLVGAIQHPDDGYIQPADLTQALCKGARNHGAEIYEHTKVVALEQQKDHSWIVKTDKGDIACEHVVSCTGNFARKTGEMVGLDIPVIPVQHQFIVTEPHPKIMERKKQGLPEMGVLRESDAGYYLREEAGGMILGPYEKGAPVCYIDGPSDDCQYELFNSDLDRLMPHIECCMHRVPAFGEVGVKDVYNGAIAYTPDGNPIVGPAPGLKNFWLNEGHSFGITAAGGAGWQLAEWMIDGEPTVDMMGVDPRRFGPYATRGYLREKNEEAYSNVFTTHFPDEERGAARPLKTAPCYDRMKSLGAVFGSVYGWERPNWFMPTVDYSLSAEDINQEDPSNVLLNKNHSSPLDDGRIVEKNSFRRSNYFEHVGNECKHVNKKVGLLDMSAFAKCIVKGPGAESWLESLFANKIPKNIGRINLVHMLSLNGGVRAEFTVYKTAPQTYYLVSAGAFESHDHDYLFKLKPEDGSVDVQRVTTQAGVLVIAGPKSRDVLQKLTDTDLSNDNFKWLTGKKINVGYATADALRVNFVGELGWELHHPIEMQNYIFDQVMKAGEEFEIKPFGIRAMDSMRLEKSYRLIPREMSIEYSAFESGLDRFVRLDKQADFIGKSSLLKWKSSGFDNGFVTLEVLGIKDADARGSEAIYQNGKIIGRATSGGYGWRCEKSLALGIVRLDLTKIGTKLDIEILGEKYKAVVIDESPFDSANECLRS
ncbi:MAG: FAD-dependent oxidoreductase [Gammaproteobacteria bacterium]|jgi:dimethylglycine dehydrogenase|nr:FAD-dependent oxidoreductase [Gammaproteobacteria bacterium]